MPLILLYVSHPTDEDAVCFSEVGPREMSFGQTCDYAWRRTFDVPDAIGYKIHDEANPERILAQFMIFNYQGD